MKLLPTLAALLLAVSAQAANWFMTQPGGGSFNGADWNNAWSDLTGINWPVVNPGDTIYLGGGGPPFTNTIHMQGSGTLASPIKIQRVLSTDLAATGASGWSSAFDSQIVIGISNAVIGGGFIFDGYQPMSNLWIDGRMDSGISIRGNDLIGNVCGVMLSNGVNNLTLANIEVVGRGSPNTTGFIFANDARGFNLYSYGPNPPPNNILLTNCRVHGVVAGMYAGAVSGLTVDHCLFYDIWALGGWHDNVAYMIDGITNLTWRYNQIWNWATEGIGFFGTVTNAWVYGNVWHDCSQGSGGGESAECIAVADVGMNGPLYFYNNTIANAHYVAYPAETWAAGTAATNNLVWNCTAPTVGLPKEDYTFSSGAATGAHSISGGSYPFASPQGAWPYVSTNNLAIVGTVGAGYPAAKGLNLGAPYNIDLNGNTHPALWSIGAFVAPGLGTSLNGGRVNGGVILH